MLERGFHDIIYFIKEILEEDIHFEQEYWLKNSLFKQYAFLRAGNRWGKGDCGMFKGAYLAFYKPVEARYKGKKVHLLNTSLSQDQANIILNKFEERLLNKKYFSWLITGIKYMPFPHIIFKNNVVWWFRNATQNGKYLEGRSYFWTNFDEADLQPNLTSLIEKIIEPRTWDMNGFIDIMTTPRRGKKNSYALWKRWEDLPESKRYLLQGDSRNNSFLPPEAIERMNILPKRLFAQNVVADWTSDSGAFADDVVEYSKSISTGILQEAAPGHLYVKAWDLARSSTWCVCVIIDIKQPHQIVHCIRFKESADNRNPEYWRLVEAKIKSVHKKWPGVTVIDYTGVGDVVGSYIQEISPILIKLTEKLKADIITHCVTEFEHGNVGLPLIEHVAKDGTTWLAENEIRDFQIVTGNIIWDFVCALFLAIWVADGKHSQSLKPKSQSNPSVVVLKGINKHADLQHI